MCPDETWTPVATFTRGFEGDVAISRLESEGIPALKRRNDSVGVFGAGFEGPTAGGVTVLVPKDLADRARELLEEGDNQA